MLIIVAWSERELTGGENMTCDNANMMDRAYMDALKDERSMHRCVRESMGIDPTKNPVGYQRNIEDMKLNARVWRRLGNPESCNRDTLFEEGRRLGMRQNVYPYNPK